MHPPILTQLQREITDIIGPTERPGFEQIKEMKYLRAVINGESYKSRGTFVSLVIDGTIFDLPKESLRLMPPVPFDVKTSVNSTVLVDPKTGVRHYVPANTPYVPLFVVAAARY